MLIKKLVGLSLVATLAASANAEEAVTAANVMSMAKSANLGFEYRAALVYDNNMYKKADADKEDPTKTAHFGPIDVLKATVKGDINEQVKYHFSYNLVSSKTEYAKATWSPIEMMSVTLGSDKVKQNGWETYDVGSFKMFNSAYFNGNLPFENYASSLSLGFKAAGTVSLQLLNDRLNADQANATGILESDDANDKSSRDFQKSGQEKQPAMIIEWMGDFGMPVKPLIQIGSYDMNHSKYFTLGLKFAQDAISAQVDFTQDQRARLNEVSTGVFKEKVDTATNIALSASYNLGAFEPFLKFTSFDVKQDDDDLKGNAIPTSSGISIKDNETGIAVGSFIMQQGKSFRPFFSIVQMSEKNYVTLTDPDKIETRTDMKVMLGAAGTF